MEGRETHIYGNGEAPTWVESMAVAPDGALWVGSSNPQNWNGLARFDGAQFTHEPGPPDGSIRALCFDDRGWLWIGTSEGVWVRTGRGIERVLDRTDGLPCEIITALLWQDDKLFIGTEGGGLVLYHPKKKGNYSHFR